VRFATGLRLRNHRARGPVTLTRGSGADLRYVTYVLPLLAGTQMRHAFSP